MTTTATNSGDDYRELHCTSCGVPYDQHPGLTLTCAALQTQKVLNLELRRVNAPRVTLELFVRLGYEMECLSTGRCAELLGESIVAFRERGWVQSRIRDALAEAVNRVGGGDSLKADIEQILKDFE